MIALETSIWQVTTLLVHKTNNYISTFPIAIDSFKNQLTKARQFKDRQTYTKHKYRLLKLVACGQFVYKRFLATSVKFSLHDSTPEVLDSVYSEYRCKSV